MNKKIILLIRIILASISLISSYFSIIFALNETTLFNKIVLWTSSYLSSYLVLFLLMEKLSKKYSVIRFIIHNILGIPMKFFLLYNYLTAPLVTIFTFLIIYFAPSFLAYKVMSNITQLINYTEGTIYILSIISLLLFAYFGQTIMRYLIKMLDPILLKQYLIKYTNNNYTRLYTYILMSVIYCLYNYLSFSKISLHFFPNEMMNVIKEVFVSFVAIDTLIQIILSHRTKKQDINTSIEID